MQVRVEYIYDPESRKWCFRVPGLGIIGGADTRGEAERAALDAIAYALEDEPDTSSTDEAEIEHPELAIKR
jgi:hypothetical protein